ncbi:hypothetical protein C8F01DRAFT_1250207 [Mycena amicta]|nr:hypothetical protein C8F01DRAFT_1250207 [Mycena amicta]
MRRVTQFLKNGFPTQQMSVSLYSTAIIPATCFGDTKGNAFDDGQAVQGTAAIMSDVARAIKSIKVMHSTSTVDGIQIIYAPSTHDGAKDTVAHGTTDKCTDVNVRRPVVTIGDTESIIAISGTTDTTPASGLRPFGGETGAPFSVNVACQFIALSGFAINTHKSLAQLHGQPGGLYGLVFDNTNFDLEY